MRPGLSDRAYQCKGYKRCNEGEKTLVVAFIFLVGLVATWDLEMVSLHEVATHDDDSLVLCEGPLCSQILVSFITYQLDSTSVALNLQVPQALNPKLQPYTNPNKL